MIGKDWRGLLDAEDWLLIKADLAAIVDSRTLRTNCLSAVCKTKNYAALPLLEPCIRGGNLCEFYHLVAQAVQDGNFFLLQKFLPQKLEPGWVSRACGFEGVDYDLIPEGFEYAEAYMKGIIETDNLELFLKYRFIVRGNSTCTLSWASEYCAQKIMTECGFSETNVELYIKKALCAGKKDTLLFLCDRCDPHVDKQIKIGVLWLLYAWNIKLDHPFLVDCFHNKLVRLSEEDWQALKEIDPELYQKVQDDV